MSIADKLKTVAQKMEDVYRSGLFKYAPKSTASGESIFLENSAPEPFVSMTAYGHSRQNTTEGKNLYSGEDVTVSAYAEYMIEPIPIGTYTISAKVESSYSAEYYGILLLNSSDAGFYTATLKDLGNGRYGWTLDSTQECVELGFYVANSDASLSGHTTTFSDIQIEVGESATDYEPYTHGASPNPYYPQPIESAKEVKVLGKNILPPQNVNVFLGVTNQWWDCVRLSFTFEKGKTYTVSFDTPNDNCKFYVNMNSGFDYYEFDGNGQRFSFTQTFTEDAVLDNGQFISLNNASDVGSGEFTNFQIELNDYATEYEPYKEPKTLTLPTLYGIGDVRDYVDYDRKKLIHKIQKYTCTDVTDVWRYLGDTSNRKENAFFRMQADGIKVNTELLCTHLEGIYTIWQTDKDYLGCECVEANCIDFTIPYSLLGVTYDSTSTEKEDAMRTWLQSNTLEFYGELAEPIETDLTDEQIYAFKRLRANSPNTTIVGQGQLDVTYIVDNR